MEEILIPARPMNEEELYIEIRKIKPYYDMYKTIECSIPKLTNDLKKFREQNIDFIKDRIRVMILQFCKLIEDIGDSYSLEDGRILIGKYLKDREYKIDLDIHPKVIEKKHGNVNPILFDSKNKAYNKTNIYNNIDYILKDTFKLDDKYLLYYFKTINRFSSNNGINEHQAYNVLHEYYDKVLIDFKKSIEEFYSATD